MSKFLYFKSQRPGQTNDFLVLNKPMQPVKGKNLVAENRFFDPSSSLPRGQCYPIPSFFDYRAIPKDFDLQ